MSAETLRGRNLNASLTVNDLEKSLTWYRDVVGFHVDREFERDGRTMAVSLQASRSAAARWTRSLTHASGDEPFDCTIRMVSSS